MTPRTWSRLALMVAAGVASTAVGTVPARADAPAVPPTLTLSGTLRDVDHAHTPSDPGNAPSTAPDFESHSGDDRAIVGPTLASDGTPTYAGGAGGTSTTSGAASFAEWFHDTTGVTATVPLSLTLTRVGTTAEYSYVNDSFFPLDGAGWNAPAQGATPQVERGHNYSFTYQAHNLFTYRGGEDFTFCGDDDVFTYIAGQRVVNLGGVHGKECASVSLDTLGLTVGNTYPFDLFYAERHTVGSNFEFTTSVQLISGSRPTPTVASSASPATTVGGSISDTATLSGGTSPTGVLDFSLFAPGDTTCSRPISTSTVPVDGNGTYTAPSETATTSGTYSWTVTYSGDPNNAAVSTTCGASTVVVRPLAVPVTQPPSAAPVPPVALVITGITPMPKRLLVAFRPVGVVTVPFVSFRVTCTPTIGGIAHSSASLGSPALVRHLRDNLNHMCVVVGLQANGHTVVSPPHPGRPGQLPHVTLHGPTDTVTRGSLIQLTGLATAGGQRAHYKKVLLTARRDGSHVRVPVATVLTDADGRFHFGVRVGAATGYQVTFRVADAVARNPEVFVRLT